MSFLASYWFVFLILAVIFATLDLVGNRQRMRNLISRGPASVGIGLAIAYAIGSGLSFALAVAGVLYAIFRP